MASTRAASERKGVKEDTGKTCKTFHRTLIPTKEVEEELIDLLNPPELEIIQPTLWPSDENNDIMGVNEKKLKILWVN